MRSLTSWLLVAAIILVAKYAQCTDWSQYNLRWGSFDQAERREFLILINEVRRTVSVIRGARDMAIIVWDSNLDGEAFASASLCDDAPDDSSIIGKTSYMLPLWPSGNFSEMPLTLNSSTVATIVETWTAEGDNYDHTTMVCDGSCANYLQMIFAVPHRISCSFEFCPEVTVGGVNLGPNSAGYSIVCVYDTRNFYLESGSHRSLPYVPGDACTSCPDDLPDCHMDALCFSADMCPTAACADGSALDPLFCDCGCATEDTNAYCESFDMHLPTSSPAPSHTGNVSPTGNINPAGNSNETGVPGPGRSDSDITKSSLLCILSTSLLFFAFC